MIGPVRVLYAPTFHPSSHWCTAWDAGDVEEWRIRGYWFLDKRQGELKYRLLGLCPVANEARSKAYPDDNVDAKVELFWVWFPAARDILHEAKAFEHIL